jgi:hypothetical protein
MITVRAVAARRHRRSPQRYGAERADLCTTRAGQHHDRVARHEARQATRTRRKSRCAAKLTSDHRSLAVTSYLVPAPSRTFELLARVPVAQRTSIAPATYGRNRRHRRPRSTQKHILRRTAPRLRSQGLGCSSAGKGLGLDRSGEERHVLVRPLPDLLRRRLSNLHAQIIMVAHRAGFEGL